LDFPSPAQDVQLTGSNLTAVLAARFTGAKTKRFISRLTAIITTTNRNANAAIIAGQTKLLLASSFRLLAFLVYREHLVEHNFILTIKLRDNRD
jgi:hypothetical protein